ncbi:hypothetical protein AGMMS50268_28810 [Spirochaetia bacterium]|nr:hypothetical protein AGMMS50268_28810 [Spirochaetia bacterium]
MAGDWSFAKIQEYFTNEIEENLTLDYKAADALHKSDGKKAEITKDVSAMANSDGGIIIYGIKENQEKKYLPGEITPINIKEFSKEWLEQVINTIRPKIDGVIITPIPIETSDDSVIYIVEIPKSDTAHQAKDHRYYKRFNFISEMMEDYEIRDVMGRNQYPKFDISFKIIEKFEYITTGSLPYGLDSLPIANKPEKKTETRISYTLFAKATNIGAVYANYVNIFIRIPLFFLRKDYFDYDKYAFEEDGLPYYEFYEDNTRRDVVDVKSLTDVVYGPSRYDPILPSRSRTWEFKLKDFRELSPDGHTLPEDLIKWTIHADNSPVKSGEIKFNEIEIIFER